MVSFCKPLNTVTGNATGTVDYQAGVILWSPAVLPPKGTVVTIDATKKTSTTLTVTPTGWYTSSLTIPLAATVEPRSVNFNLRINALYSAPTVTYPNGDGPQGSEFIWTVGPTHTDIHLVSVFSVKDDGLGGIVAASMNGAWGPVGTINYATGLISIATSSLQTTANIGVSRMASAGALEYPAHSRAVRGVVSGNCVCVFSPFNAPQFPPVYDTPLSVSLVAGSAASDSAPISVTVPAFLGALEYVPTGKTMRNVSFRLGSDAYASGATDALIRNANASTGLGTDVGNVLGAVGTVQLSTWSAGTTSAVSDFRAALLPAVSGDAADFGSAMVTFRTATAPLRPASLQLTGNMEDGTAINVSAAATGAINSARVKGMVDVETGVVRLAFCNPSPTALGVTDISDWGIPGVGVINLDRAKVETLRYNAVAYAHMPLDAAVLGLDPVRLPSDGRVPIFKSGRVLVVHNTAKLSPQTVSNGQTVYCGRVLLARLRVFGNDGLEITSGVTKNLDAGTITFTNVAGMSQPVAIEHRIEDEALCADAQITGDLRLTRPLTHDFPADTSYVSSAYVVGTLQAAAQDSFAQTVWTDAWSDSRIGAPLLAQYDDTAHPIVVTNAGAITERWLIQFTSNTAFTLAGEEVGQIISGDTATPLAPVNPATGVPYFTLQSGGWGAGWVAGNVLRFNTRGANFPLWIARTVQQSPSAAPGTDQMTISIRGDIDQ